MFNRLILKSLNLYTMAEMLIEPIDKYALSKKDQPKVLFAKVGIVGCGTTGQKIARMISCKGIEVIFLELSEEKIQQAFKGIENDLDSMINHWGMTESEKSGILSRITGTTKYEDFKGCDMVIESILSKIREFSIDVRKGVFKNIEPHVDSNTIIATNTTTLAITELSSELEYKERCVSMHFFTTMPGSQIVEVVRGLYTSDESYNNVIHFLKLLGRKVIPVEESPGLISVRLFVSLINEACEVLIEGVSSMKDIDLTMRTGFGMPLGPFEIADKIGLDKILRWMENLYNEFGDMKYKASPLIKRLVRANQTGIRVGKGFYHYDKNGKKTNSKSLKGLHI